MMVQTADPAHAIFTALKRGDPGPYLAAELATRQALALPPAGEVIMLEVSGLDDPEELTDVFGSATVFGPAEVGDRLRWLIQGEDLTDVRARLRPAVAKLRDRGARVRIDVDPREL